MTLQRASSTLLSGGELRNTSEAMRCRAVPSSMPLPAQDMHIVIAARSTIELEEFVVSAHHIMMQCIMVAHQDIVYNIDQ